MAGLLEHARQLRAHAVVLHHQAGGAVDQTGRHAHILRLVFQRFFELGQQRFESLSRFFSRLLFGFVLQFAQIDRALGNRLQWRFIKVLQVVERPLVHAVGHQQHFDAFFLENFKLRAVLGGCCRVGGDVVNRFLAFFHARLVVGKTHANAVGGARCKAQQLGQTVFVGIVFAQAFFQHGAEFCVELAVFADAGRCFGLVFFTHDIGHAFGGRDSFWQLVVFGQVFQHAQHALGTTFADGFDVAAFLQQLTRHVQRQVGRVDHALDKAQVGRQQRFGVVHDEHALDVELDAG